MKSQKKWSKEVTEHSHALDLEKGVFTQSDPHQIALSLKRAALKSTAIKGTPYQSAMSMLDFYINRAGSKLSTEDKNKLEQAKFELRRVFHKEETK